MDRLVSLEKQLEIVTADIERHDLLIEQHKRDLHKAKMARLPLLRRREWLDKKLAAERQRLRWED